MYEGMLIVVDIDGTIADWSERHKQAGPEPDHRRKKTFLKWLTAIQDEKRLLADPQVPSMREILHSLNGHVVYLTARDERYRDTTLQWLEQERFPTGELYMRSPNDWRSGAEYKADKITDLIRTIRPTSTITFDDDPTGTCAKAYRRLGILHLKPTYCQE